MIRVKRMEGKRKQSWYLKQGSRGGCVCGKVTSQAANGEAVSRGGARESAGSFRVAFASFVSAVNTFSGRQAAALTTRPWRRETGRTQEACDQPEAWSTWRQAEGEKTVKDGHCRTKKSPGIIGLKHEKGVRGPSSAAWTCEWVSVKM